MGRNEFALVAFDDLNLSLIERSICFEGQERSNFLLIKPVISLEMPLPRSCGLSYNCYNFLGQTSS